MSLNWLKQGFVVLVLSVGSATHAGSLFCTGTIIEMGVHTPGLLLVRLSSMNARVVMCSIDTAYSTQGGPSITAPTCEGMYANLMAARASGQTVQLMMDGDAVPAQCSSFIEWTYVGLRYAANLP